LLSLQLWMRIVGTLYLVSCIGAIAGAPIRAEGPAGLLERARAGDATARFVVTTWIALGGLIGVLGAALLYFSRAPEQARALAWTAVAVELAWGIPIDLLKILRGQKRTPSVVWIVIHVAVAGSGLVALGVFGRS
jgi:membrane associated rhomboid family serine protease